MELPSYFTDFLREIRPNQDQLDALREAHSTLRQRIRDDEDLAPIYISDFLQGSYRRSTAVRPQETEKADVDVIIVTNLDHENTTPDEALDRFAPFLNTHYKGQWKKRGRSILVELEEVTLDLVVTAAPSEAQKSFYSSRSILTDYSIEEVEDLLVSQPEDMLTKAVRNLLEAAKSGEQWRMEPLLIPDRDAKEWQQTNPLAQIQWTWGKNKRCNTHYVNVVKAIKWWRRQYAEPKYPKSYPLEHLIGDACPDGVSTVAAGVTFALECISSAYQPYVDSGTVPYLRDRGVDQDVFLRITPEDFSAFHHLVKDAAVLARKAYDAGTVAESATLWHQLFRDPFPKGPEPDSGNDDDSGSGQKGGFSPRTSPTVITGSGRFA